MRWSRPGLPSAWAKMPRKVFAALAHLKGAPGRMEKVAFAAAGAPIYVDYAHTPDSLEKVLQALRPHTQGKLHVVFGCGGDRDKGKRPLMGQIAAALADDVIVTDDNPRSEDRRRHPQGNSGRRARRARNRRPRRGHPRRHRRAAGRRCAGDRGQGP